MSIYNALRSVLETINNAAAKCGRNPDEIKLVTVSKTVELKRVIEAVKAGATILGENRIQEAKDKISDFRSELSNYHPEWHLIGSLQKNKARHAVQLFDLIHSVHDRSLAQELDRQAKNYNKLQRVLLQVKLSDETAKHGIRENDLWELLDNVSEMENLKLEGFMTMPPFFADVEKTRPYFRRLRELAEEAVKKGHPVKELSMGMSNDFEVAIEEGSTMVRVGTAIFGQRTY